MEFIPEFSYSNVGLIATVITIIFVYKITKQSQVKLPPGPYRIPLLGTIYKHGVNITADILTDMSRVYGNIYCVFIGPQRYLILNNYDAIHDAMMRPFEFAHRGLADKYTWRLIRTDRMNGLFAKDYQEELIRDRNLTIGIMRKLGIGKPVIEHKILQEISVLESIFRNRNKASFDPRAHINRSIGNIIIHILFNKRFEHDDKELQSLLNNTDASMYYILHTTFIDSVPCLRFVPPFKGILKKFLSASSALLQTIKRLTIPMLHQFDPNHTESFVESYFESKYEPDSKKVEIDLDAFKSTLGDFLCGGVETSVTAIRWTIVYLANRQHIQEKLYKELATNTQSDQYVRYKDKDRLPYLEAVVMEVQRFSTILPLVPHKTCHARDVQLGGYCIPRNTMVLLNIHSTHMNEHTWGDPMVFRPERFINEDGRFGRHPHVIPFSIGKRACPGEILARQELCLFTANLVKKFIFYPPDGIECIDEEPVKTSTWSPKPFKVKIVAR